MRRISGTLVVALAVGLLAGGLVACGSGEDSSSSTAEAGGQAKSGSQSSGGKAEGGGEKGNAGSGGSGSSASEFVPKPHDDSGGGSRQYEVKGGDNSVQEFGKEAGGREFDEAARALHGFLDARAGGNWAATCAYMAKSVIESFERLATKAKGIEATGCAGILAKLTNPAAKQALKDEAAKADVGSLRIEGDSAFLIYTGTEGTVLAIPMKKEDGAWKVDSLAGVPLN